MSNVASRKISITLKRLNDLLQKLVLYEFTSDSNQTQFNLGSFLWYNYHLTWDTDSTVSATGLVEISSLLIHH